MGDTGELGHTPPDVSRYRTLRGGLPDILDSDQVMKF
jgi:hypothetical protein